MIKTFFNLLLATIILFLFSCREKKNNFIPFVSIIKGQLNDIDTSLYSIIKLTYRDTAWGDTEYVKREQVRGLAKYFLSLPDLSPRRYTEESIPGPANNLSTITYKPIHPDREEIQQVDIIVDPTVDPAEKTQIKTIIINRLFSNKDSSVEQKMLWQVDRSFLVTTILQKKGLPENTSTFKVIWNEDEDE